MRMLEFRLTHYPMAKRKSGHGPAIHDKHKLRKNHCFACGKDNAQGMHLKFSLDEATRKAVCHFKLTGRYPGPPGHAHGGIIATILDEAMGKVNKFRQVVALTSEMTVNFLKPVPLNKPLRVESREETVSGRKHINVGEILNQQGEVLARGRAT